jgi:hypothetical protein
VTESDTSKELNKQLQQAQHLAALNNNPDYQEYLLPYLKGLTQNKWLDPTSCPNSEEFIRAYDRSYGRYMAYVELINFLAGQENTIKTIVKRLDGRKRTI